jgi:hypothetical protein
MHPLVKSSLARCARVGWDPFSGVAHVDSGPPMAAI